MRPAVVVALVLLTGCGGSGAPRSSTGEPPTPQAPTKAEFIVQADLICAEMTSETEALGQPEDSTQVADFLSEAVDVAEDALTRLRELQPPAGDEDVVDEILTGFEATLPVARDLLQAFEAGDQARVDDLGEDLARLEKEGNKRAKAYGMNACAEGS